MRCARPWARWGVQWEPLPSWEFQDRRSIQKSGNWESIGTILKPPEVHLSSEPYTPALQRLRPLATDLLPLRHAAVSENGVKTLTLCPPKIQKILKDRRAPLT